MSCGASRFLRLWVVFVIVVFTAFAGSVFGCEVEDVDVFVGATKAAVQVGNAPTELSLCPCADEFWVKVEWDAKDYGDEDEDQDARYREAHIHHPPDDQVQHAPIVRSHEGEHGRDGHAS